MVTQADRDRQELFLRLFEPCRQPLWRFVRSMVRSSHEAEDMASETILQAYQGFEKLRDDQAFTSYLFTIAHRLIKRHRWRRSILGEYNEADAEARPDGDALPDDKVDVVLLREALQRLPEKMREAVVLFDILGFSLEEVRNIQGGTLSGVKSRLRRGRSSLAQHLGATNNMEEPELPPSIEQFHHQPIL